jgi:hypothetical protein
MAANGPNPSRIQFELNGALIILGSLLAAKDKSSENIA